MADIFISYARLDRERVAPLKDALDGLGLNTFFDVDGLDGGDTFPDVLDREVKNAKIVLGCWTPHALQRDWVKAECAIAQEQRTLVPLEFDPLGPIDVPAAFFRLQRVNLASWRGESKHEGWLAAVRAISRRLHRPDIYDRANAAAALSASGKLASERTAHEMDGLWADWMQLAVTTDRDALLGLQTRAEGTLIAQLAASRVKDLSRSATVRFLTGSEAVGLPPLRGWRLARFVGLRVGLATVALGGAGLAYTLADRRADAAVIVAAEMKQEKEKVEQKAAVLEEQMTVQQQESLRKAEALQAEIARKIADAEKIRSELTLELQGMEHSIETVQREMAARANEFEKERDLLAEQLLALRASSSVGAYVFRPRNEFMKDDFDTNVRRYFDALPGNVPREVRALGSVGRYESTILARSDLFTSYQIDTPKRIAAFLGQVAIESGWFKYTTDNLNYSEKALVATFGVYRRNPELAKAHARNPELVANTVYGGRLDLGNTDPGDGWKFRSRGLIQITGRNAYRRTSELLGIDLLSDPDLLERDFEVAIAAAALEWTSRDLNQYADQWDLVKISRSINRGNPDSSSSANHEDLRIHWSEIALRAMSGETLDMTPLKD